MINHETGENDTARLFLTNEPLNWFFILNMPLIMLQNEQPSNSLIRLTPWTRIPQEMDKEHSKRNLPKSQRQLTQMNIVN